MKKRIIDFASVSESTALSVGDIIELRDFSPYIPEDTPDGEIPWNTREYYLLNGTHGHMLHVSATLPITPDTPYDTIDFSTNGMPGEIEIALPMKGKFAIWAGNPNVDLALDDDGFIAVFTESGGRYGRMIGMEKGREYRVFWKNAELDNTRLRIRIPFGTFPSAPSVNAALTSLRFIKLDGSADLAPTQGKADRDFIMVIDGFSHYNTYGIPGECFDKRLSRAYENSDVKILMPQIMGPLLWKSDINSYLGEGVTADEFAGKRIGDVRVIKYVEDSIKNGYDVFSVLPEYAHKRGQEVHFSIRANLYFESDTKYMKGNDCLNGRWYSEHREYRLPNCLQLDYGIKEVRDYHLSIYRDVLEKFDVDGINLDLTRWPKCFDAKYHTPEVLIGFCRDLRALADEYSEKKGRHIALSLLMVEYYHSYCTLEAQAIDFEALMQSGTLDFVCLQTNEPEKYAPIAHRYGVKFHGIIDTESPYTNNNNDDPLWKLPDGSITDDPCAGYEFETQKFVGTAPAPFEQVGLMDTYYDGGADGIAKINSFMGSLYFRDCGHSQLVKRHAEDGSVFGQEAGDYIFFK